MKLLTQAIFVSLIFLVACTQHAQEQTLDDINIQIDVIPNPPTIGEATLLIKLTDALKNDMNPKTGRHVYSPLVALSLMIFYVYAAQCMATFAIVRRETNSWKWPLFMIVYMTVLAYSASFIVYQGGIILGYS